MNKLTKKSILVRLPYEDWKLAKKKCIVHRLSLNRVMNDLLKEWIMEKKV